jgi:hypothetical protein
VEVRKSGKLKVFNRAYRTHPPSTLTGMSSTSGPSRTMMRMKTRSTTSYRRYEPPNCVYLIQWWDDEKRFVANWERGSFLKQMENDMIDQLVEWIDDWKTKYPTWSYRKYKTKFPFKYTASYDRMCFFNAFRLARLLARSGGDKMFMTDERSLVRADVIENYITVKKACGIDFCKGVSSANVNEFIEHLRNQSVNLSINDFKKTRVGRLLNSAGDLFHYPLENGIYVVGGGDVRALRHTFVLRVQGETRDVLDELDEADGEPRFIELPLLQLKWLRRVGFVHMVATRPKRRGPKKSKNTLLKRHKVDT